MNAMTPHGRTVAGVQNRYVSKNCPGLRSKTGPTGRYRLAGPNLGRLTGNGRAQAPKYALWAASVTLGLDLGRSYLQQQAANYVDRGGSYLQELVQY